MQCLLNRLLQFNRRKHQAGSKQYLFLRIWLKHPRMNLNDTDSIILGE